ncbi:MAG: FkbM family methyltransferase [Pseudomonadota bacterium]
MSDFRGIFVRRIGKLLPRFAKNLLLKSGIIKDLVFGKHGHGFWEERLLLFFGAVVKPGWICVDVGANFGFHTIPLAKLCAPNGFVYAFEAFPETAVGLQHEIDKENLSSCVKVESVAISDGTEKKVHLFAGRDNHHGEWSIVPRYEYGRSATPEIEVDAIDLDSYFKGKPRIDLVKIDVEEAENKVLAGMQRILKEDRPILMVEFHNDALALEGCAKYLSSDYDFFDPDGCPTDPGRQWRYHTYCFPKETTMDVEGIFASLGPRVLNRKA